MAVKDLLAKALALPAEERAQIAQKLIVSLEEEAPDDEVDTAWATEIDRRMQQVDEGTAKLHDWEAVRKDLRAAVRSAPPRRRRAASPRRPQ